MNESKERTNLQRREFTTIVAASALVGAARTRCCKVDEIRVAVIGHSGRGNYGHGLEKVWRDVPGTKVVAVADAQEKGLEKVSKQLGAIGFLDYRRMLEEVKPSIVAISPRWPDQHRNMVVAAAENRVAGIYLEKPMCRSLQEADEMVAACEKSGTKLAIATQTRYSPQVKIMGEMIKSGKLGRIVEIRTRGKDDHRGGGEDLWVLGTHVLDLMRHFGGDATQCYSSVWQNGKSITKQDVKEGNEALGPLAGDEVHATFRLSSGATGFFDSVRGVKGNPSRFGIRIFGTKGVVELYDTGSLPVTRYLPESSWSSGRSKSRWQSITSNGIDKPETIKNGGLHEGNVLAIIDLISAIDKNRQPIANIYEARKTVEMIAAVFESQRIGRPVQIPLENRRNPLTLL